MLPLYSQGFISIFKIETPFANTQKKQVRCLGLAHIALAQLSDVAKLEVCSMIRPRYPFCSRGCLFAADSSIEEGAC